MSHPLEGGLLWARLAGYLLKQLWVFSISWGLTGVGTTLTEAWAPVGRTETFPRSSDLGTRFLLPVPAQSQPFLLGGLCIGWDQPCVVG